MLTNHARYTLFYFILCGFLLHSNSAQAIDYASCLAEKLQGITHDAAVTAIIEACQAQYPHRAAVNPANAPAKATLIDDRYRDNVNGTITDTRTNLTWMRCSLGQQWTGSTCAGKAMTMNWNDALRTAMSYSYAGHSDWRVPTVDELDTLVQCPAGRKPSARPAGRYVNDTNGECHGNEYNTPKININAFPNTPAVWCWSSSPNANYSGDAWVIYVTMGHFNLSSKRNGAQVRLVRAGQ
jgi:hypothetical protein